jgi:hypothetical protein
MKPTHHNGTAQEMHFKCMYSEMIVMNKILTGNINRKQDGKTQDRHHHSRLNYSQL